MRKKVTILMVILLTITMLGIFTKNVQAESNSNVLAGITNTTTNENSAGSKVAGKLVDMKESAEKSMEDYKKAYGSEAYGFAAYILNKIQVYSIPLCFVGIAISAIYQYVLGIRKLDTRDKGFKIMISIVTIFIIAQILPLIFAIVVKGWGE